MQTIGILVFDDVEILDFSGPYEVFTTAERVRRRLHAEAGRRFDCMLVAPSMHPVRSRGGMLVLPEQALPPAGSIDVLIVPGGEVSAARRDAATIAWIAEQARHADLVASICTGAFLLAEAGLLDGREATTHWEDCDDLEREFPALRVRRGVSWVDCGKVVSSGGISAGIDMSLHLVERLAGRQLAEATARQMEYRWNRNGNHDFCNINDADDANDANHSRLSSLAAGRADARPGRSGGSAPIREPA
ncbi:DJ-1/PfpI family protein [Noviherbaspirillum galbum]|uniref:DJ-1/PfpI family protein n=1 Tax=Noviherbaspirillum galbum TaxID=2709383 RepID=A0A6B3SR48_9BURK|nr:DJ-1/PfpI family protein [Noviherbaspirillum galbum]NEX63233.1 DJ-1/PfpI family protein [Noviherbaspirillum galbum]